MKLSDKERSEVDMRVAQELKNNQDFIYKTNMSINNLDNMLRSHSDRINKIYSDYSSKMCKMESEFEELKYLVLSKLHDFNHRIGDIAIEFSELKDHVLNDVKYLSAHMLSKEDYFKNSSEEKKRINDLYILQMNDRSNLLTSFSQLEFKLKELISSISKDIPEVPDVDAIKKDFDDKLDLVRHDFNGLKDKIEIINKAVAYDQKKFENVYTLIKRLQGEK